MRDLLGGPPLAVIAKLLLASLLVGWAMTYVGITPLDLLDQIIAFIERLWREGFDALGRLGRYALLGAVVVIPVFLLGRAFARRS